MEAGRRLGAQCSALASAGLRRVRGERVDPHSHPAFSARPAVVMGSVGPVAVTLDLDLTDLPPTTSPLSLNSQLHLASQRNPGNVGINSYDTW